MQLSTNRRNLGRIAGILGLLQSLSWAGLSLAGIILHNWSPNLVDEMDDASYTRLIGLSLYFRFINKDIQLEPGTVVRQKDFTIFMWIYFILSVGWAALSIDLLTAIHFNKSRQKLIIFIWGVVTLITSLIDLIFTCLLARDYANCSLYSSPCYLITGIAMTIAARGFTLWAFNVAFSFTMLYVASKIPKARKLPNLFANHSIPRVTIPQSTNNNNSNNNVQQRGGDISPNFLSNDSSFPSFLYQDKYKDDTLTSAQSRRSKNSDANVPSFFSRGEKFSY